MRGLAASCGSCINVDGAKIRPFASRLKPSEAQPCKITHFRRSATAIYTYRFTVSIKNAVHSPHILPISPIRENTGQLCAFHGIYPANLFLKRQQPPSTRPPSVPLQIPTKSLTALQKPPKQRNSLSGKDIPIQNISRVTFCFSEICNKRKKVRCSFNYIRHNFSCVLCSFSYIRCCFGGIGFAIIVGAYGIRPELCRMSRNAHLRKTYTHATTPQTACASQLTATLLL